MKDFPSGQSAVFPGWDFWKSRVTRRTYRRVQRWSFRCGCPRVCTRRRGECCQWSFRRCTERAGGRCSTLTPMWWICIRWGLTTMAWGPRCCTLTVQRTLRSHRRCCRRSSVASDGTWTPLRMPTTRTRLRWWSVWTAWRRLCSRRGRVASTTSRAGRRARPPNSPPPAWFSTTVRGRSPIYSPDLQLKDTETGQNLSLLHDGSADFYIHFHFDDPAGFPPEKLFSPVASVFFSTMARLGPFTDQDFSCIEEFLAPPKEVSV